MMPIVSRKRRMVGDNGDNEEECKCPFVLFFNPSPSLNKHQNNLLTFLPPFSNTDWDMVFPDDERESNPASFKFLEIAHRWKRMQASASTASAPSAPAPTAPSTSTSLTLPSPNNTAQENGDDDSDASMPSSDEES